MRRLLTLASALGAAGLFAVAAGCDDAEPTAKQPWAPCQASDQAFVRRASVQLVGRAPWGQTEVMVLADMLSQLRSRGEPEARAREIVARTMMLDEAFEDHWFDAVMDMLRVPRPPFVHDNQWNVQQSERCYEEPVIAVTDALAAYVRDHGPEHRSPPLAQFTLGNLLRSSLKLDDLTPIYRAHLFHLVTLALPGANVDPLELERERRRDFGVTFESAYLNRSPTCLECHNGEHTVAPTTLTGEQRFWPVPGLFEAAIYGDSYAPEDPLRYRSVLRHVDVVDNEGEPAWGWQPLRCGKFKPPAVADPLEVDSYFGTIHSTPDNPQLGKIATVWSLEHSLREGFAGLAKDGLQMDEAGRIDDPNEAFAYLTSMAIAEQVWLEVMGRPLTIAHHFPRTSDQAEMLEQLTERFIASNYSLKALLAEIVALPVFNLSTPESACGELYGVPLLFEPFALDRAEPAERGNTFGDVVHALPARSIRSALHDALAWPDPLKFPPAEGDEQEFQIVTGFFNTAAAPGFRGMDFQARLTWESRYGACTNPGVEDDFITQLLAAAEAGGATLEDVVIALKDRLVGEPELSDAEERQAVEVLLGRGVMEPASSDPELEGRLRLVCGALVASPQFMLAGLPPPDSTTAPKLTLPGFGYQDHCSRLAERFASVGVAYQVDCTVQPLVVRAL